MPEIGSEDVKVNAIHVQNIYCFQFEVENKIKTLSDSNSRYKTQIESLKQGMAASNREKTQNDEKVFKLLEEIDRKVG